MSDLTDDSESLCVRFLVTDEAAARPTEWHVALFGAAPSDAGGGTEISTGGYARQEVTFVEAGGIGSNDADLTFTASGASWGAIVAVGIFDASTAGTLRMWKALTPTTTIADGQSFIIRAGDLTVTFS